MPLYNEKGRIEYLKLDELKNVIGTYTSLMARVKSLEENLTTGHLSGAMIQAKCLLNDIPDMREIPGEVRHQLYGPEVPTDSYLNNLEERCNLVLGKKSPVS